MSDDPIFDSLKAFRSTQLGLEASTFASSEIARMFKVQQETRKLLGPSFPEDFVKTIGLTKFGATAEMLDRILPPTPRLASDLSRLSDSLSAVVRTNQIGAVAEMLKQISKPNPLLASEMFRINESVSVLGRDIQKQMGLALRQNLGLASIGMNKGIAAQIEGALSGLRSPLLKTGFLLTADLAFSDQVGRGLASDVLLHYANPLMDRASLFESSLEFVQQDDEDGWDLKSNIENLESILTKIERNQASDAGKWMALIIILTFLLDISNSFFQIKGFQNDVAAQKISAEAEARKADLEVKQQVQLERDKHHIRYLIDRTPLRVEPHRQATVIRQVFPDQLLNVIDGNGDWLRVEVYDYGSDQPIEGWLHRRNVRAAP